MACISFKSDKALLQMSVRKRERERDTHILDPWCSGPIPPVYWVRSW